MMEGKKIFFINGDFMREVTLKELGLLADEAKTMGRTVRYQRDDGTNYYYKLV